MFTELDGYIEYRCYLKYDTFPDNIYAVLIIELFEDSNDYIIQKVKNVLKNKYDNSVIFTPKNNNVSRMSLGSVIYCCYQIKNCNVDTSEINSQYLLNISDIPEDVCDPLALLVVNQNTTLTAKQTLKYIPKLTPELMVYLDTRKIYLHGPSIIQYYCNGDINNYSIKILLYYAIFIIKFGLLVRCGYCAKDKIIISSTINILGCYIDIFDNYLHELLSSHVHEDCHNYFINKIDINYNFE